MSAARHSREEGLLGAWCVRGEDWFREVAEVALVDPDDDALWRWVLQHYRYDPHRRQRRNVTVAAFDNQREFESELAAYNRRITEEIETGDRDPKERVTGVIRHPGHDAQQAFGRLVQEAVRHGVDPRGLLAAGGCLPSNVSVFGWDADGEPWSVGGGEPPGPPEQ